MPQALHPHSVSFQIVGKREGSMKVILTPINSATAKTMPGAKGQVPCLRRIFNHASSLPKAQEENQFSGHGCFCCFFFLLPLTLFILMSNCRMGAGFCP